MYATLLTALPLMQKAASSSHGTGTEWMVVASILAPMVVLILLAFFGRSRTV